MRNIDGHVMRHRSDKCLIICLSTIRWSKSNPSLNARSEVMIMMRRRLLLKR
jgi:hypothetical protein